MCGFTGDLTRYGHEQKISSEILQSMMNTIVHRGPDSHGEWKDPSNGVILGHRRLAILDLSPAGHQPMISSSGRYVIVFNGEIYNHLKIRETLNMYWRGHSDTETLLASIEANGIKATLEKSEGMFAFAVWDREEKVLYLTRDRMGEKPLYYSIQNGVLVFGSEISTLEKFPNFKMEVDPASVKLLIQRKYIPSPHTIYKNVFKLRPLYTDSFFPFEYISII